MTRHAGVILPLFSAVSTSSWGIGEAPDVVPLSRWLSSAGFDRLMLLPIGPLAAGVTSPYSAISAMAIDPMYIGLEAVEEFARAGGRSALSDEAQHALSSAVASPIVHYASVRRAKVEALDLAFTRFLEDEWNALTPRAGALAAYIARERWWLDDYALFQALTEAAGGVPWHQWPAAVRDRDPGALDDARRQVARHVLRHQYWQWIAESQWQQARTAVRALEVRMFGDLPFGVGADSADAWVRAGEFIFDASTGAPPDAFSATGQDWHLPVYRWDAIAAGGYTWLQQRARRMASLYDGFRIDHLVGFYRTYARPQTGDPYFTPGDEHAQLAQGERILRIFLESGATILAEDLGTVPDFVRGSLGRLGVPGCKVLRWERDWHAPDRPFRDPAGSPAVSVAMTGTHDTATLAVWWDAAADDERTAILALPALWPWRFDPARGWSDDLRDALLELVYRSGSNELFLPMADVFGWRDRINTPGIVNDENWTWRLPWRVDQLGGVPDAEARARFCAALAQASARHQPA